MKRFVIFVFVATSAFAASKVMGPSGARTQAHMSAAGNKPVLKTDGMPLVNQSGFYARVCAGAPDAGGALGGDGGIVFHSWPEDQNATGWVEIGSPSTTITTSQAGLRCVITQAYPVEVPSGWIYVECRNCTSQDAGPVWVTGFTGRQ